MPDRRRDDPIFDPPGGPPFVFADGFGHYGPGDQPIGPIGGFASGGICRPRAGEPVSMRSRVDVRPGFWRRLREVFWRGPPRTLHMGFTFGSPGPDGQVDLRTVEVSTIAPDGMDTIQLDFEVYVNGTQRLDMYPHTAYAAVMENKR